MTSRDDDRDAERFIEQPDPTRTDAHCTPGDHRIRNAKTGMCDWCERPLTTPDLDTLRAEAETLARRITAAGYRADVVMRAGERDARYPGERDRRYQLDDDGVPIERTVPGGFAKASQDDL